MEITYEFEGKYIPTNRIRHVKVNASNEAQANYLFNQKNNPNDYEDLHISGVKFVPAYDWQIQEATKLGLENPQDYSSIELRAYIAKKQKCEAEPNPDLVEFVEDRGIFYTPFFGKASLYRHVFHSLEGVDLFAFFVFCVYRYYSTERNGNLDKSIFRDNIYAIAAQIESPKALEQLRFNYTGDDLRYFGTVYRDGGDTIKGGSKQTGVFKSTIKALIDANLISEESYKRKRYVSEFRFKEAPVQRVSTPPAEPLAAPTVSPTQAYSPKPKFTMDVPPQQPKVYDKPKPKSNNTKIIVVIVAIIVLYWLLH